MTRKILVLFSILLSFASLSAQRVFAVDDPILSDKENELFELINEYREVNGIPTLRVSRRLTHIAEWMVHDLMDVFDCNKPEDPTNLNFHTDSLGRNVFQRLSAFGYEARIRGENIVCGTYDPEKAFYAFYDSPAHDENMAFRRYRSIGIAHYGIGWVVNFSSRAD